MRKIDEIALPDSCLNKALDTDLPIQEPNVKDQMCDTCRHWGGFDIDDENPKDNPDEPSLGQCRRYPPTQDIHAARIDVDTPSEWVFPLTTWNEHCGEWQPAQTTPPN